MKTFKFAALAALALAGIAPAQVSAQPIREGEVRTLPCEYSTGGGLVLVVRGERVGGTQSNPIVGERIIETRQCSHEPIPEVRVRPSLASVLAMPRDRARVACNESGQMVLVRSTGEQVPMPEYNCRAAS